MSRVGRQQGWYASLPPGKRRAVVIVVAVSSVIGFALLVGLVYLMVMARAAQYAGREDVTIPAAIPRSEFRRETVGKSKEYILQRFGKPRTTNESARGEQSYWYYYGLSLDEITGNVDFRIQVTIDQKTGTCTGASFSSQ